MAVTATASAIALVAAILAPTQQPAPKMSVPGVQEVKGEACHWDSQCGPGGKCYKPANNPMNGTCVAK